MLKPTAGTARVAGFDVVAQSAKVRQHIGFLSANTAIYDRMTAWELVEYFGKLYGMSDEHLKRRMEEVFRSLQKINLVVRGLYGEGSRASGDFFQISNQITLGRSETTAA